MARKKCNRDRFAVYYWHEKLCMWILFYSSNDRAVAEQQAEFMKQLWKQPTKIEEVIS